jgi:hypothetical protein
MTSGFLADPEPSTGCDRLLHDDRAEFGHVMNASRLWAHDPAYDALFALFVGLRVAFSTVNDALGARPDRELHAALPAEIRDAVTFGRPVADS